MYGFWETILRRHLSRSGCSTHPPNQITGILLLLYIGYTNRRKGDSTSREYMKWNMLPSPPLVMSATAGMGSLRAATTFYKRLASMISEKKNTDYSQTVNWIRSMQFCLTKSLNNVYQRSKIIRTLWSSQGHPGTNWPPTDGRTDLLNFNFISLLCIYHFSYPLCVW